MSEYNFDPLRQEILSEVNDKQEYKYPELRILLNRIRTLPHSNAEVERLFFSLTDIATRKRTKLNPKSIQSTARHKWNQRARDESPGRMAVGTEEIGLMEATKLYARLREERKNTSHCENESYEIDDIDMMKASSSTSGTGQVSQ